MNHQGLLNGIGNKVDVLGVNFGKACRKRISLNFQRVDLGVIQKTFFENLHRV